MRVAVGKFPVCKRHLWADGMGGLEGGRHFVFSYDDFDYEQMLDGMPSCVQELESAIWVSDLPPRLLREPLLEGGLAIPEELREDEDAVLAEDDGRKAVLDTG